MLGPNNPATLTIVDDDVPTFDFGQPTYSVDEDDVSKTITVTRGGATNVAATSATGRSREAGHGDPADRTDYTLAPARCHFAAGETIEDVRVSDPRQHRRRGQRDGGPPAHRGLDVGRHGAR